MRILIAPQAFKGSLSAVDVARAVERGIKRALPEALTILQPIADGGDGTVDALVNATHGTFKRSVVTGPLGKPVSARWGILGDGRTAVIEMAWASGLRLVAPLERNPLITTSYGTGELIKAALDEGCDKVVVGLGGSATNDGGAGAMQALGATLLDSYGSEIPRGGAALAGLATIDVSGLDPRLVGIELLAASDVTNPLTGPEGASRIYGPQKGATPAMAEQLDQALAHYAEIIRKQLGVEVENVPGSGAAGGFGASLIAFLNARIVPGARLVMQTMGIEQHLEDVDLVITGEGQIDGQTAYGKAPIVLAQVAGKRGLPVIAIAGSIGEDHDVVYEHGIDAVLSIMPRAMDEGTAMARASELIEGAAERAIRLLMVGVRMHRQEKPLG